MTSLPQCAGDRELQQLLLGEMDDARAEELETHLLHCPRCVQTVRRLKADSTLLSALRQSGSVEVPQDAAVEQLASHLKQLPTVATEDPSGLATLPPAESVTLDGSGLPRDWLAPAQAPDEIGRLGGYRVLRQLGEGGMGVVFVAEDPALQRFIAIKVMKPALAADASNRERFLREARATAQVENDHIVPVHQVGEDRGVPYLVMPLLQGETLQARLRRQRRLPLAEVLRLGREMAEGLAAAHEKGLIHRDVKPSNVWLEGDAARVKVLDFGLARAVNAQDVRLTNAGSILGTPAYMAPEQVRNDRVDARADLYSLGVVMYEMLTGRLPFQQTDMISLLAAVTTEPVPPLREVAPDVPRPVADLVMRLLARQPAQRPGSAREVVEAVRAIEEGRRPRSRGPKFLVVAAGLLLLAVLGGAGWLFGPLVYRVATNQGELVVVSEDADVEVVIKQGDRVEIRDLKSKQQVRVNLAAGPVCEVELGQGGEGLKLSTTTFTLTRGQQKIVTVTAVPPGSGPGPATKPPAEATLVRTMNGHEHVVSSVAFAGDARHAVSGSWDHTVILWDLENGGQLFTFRGHLQTVRAVAVSPDGKRVASGGYDQARLWNPDGTQVRELNGHEMSVSGIAFAPTENVVYTASLDGAVRRWSAKGGKAAGFFHGDMGPVHSVAVSPDGGRFLCGCEDGTIRLWDVNNEQKPLGSWTGHQGVVHGVAFSADGKLAVSGGADGMARVWDAATGKQLHSLNHPDAVLSVAFLPGGKRVLTGCGDGVVYLWDVSGQQPLQKLRGHQGRVWSVAVSADGRRALSGGQDKTVRLWALPAAD